jgi:tRNA threonylcarbamoyladenosine biosynthesis protein TsaB
MALILQIDTATEHASICLSKNGIPVLSEISIDQKNHGYFFTTCYTRFDDEIWAKICLTYDTSAVTEGPGSYTGLRVGLASAKGLCYALQKPLITINTLKIIAVSAITTYAVGESAENYIFVPMIDARRMEVFTAIYDHHLPVIETPNCQNTG